ncbi:flavin monoamine oxidase family protein [Methylomonas rivi]|uniref:Tryptophan 2-monooxygenase n=1 Tax=Methylomonas rivi TaxID=2952226 RepID=A0ABT1U7W7_9GAMM|nr:NAD(P)/FAD-dependent oxidoreductase [Methylomonas sp. WSC-6]MCQ8129944.1 FAD-dependent oxidoreductase [Methylomonas sp. WSC-6]
MFNKPSCRLVLWALAALALLRPLAASAQEPSADVVIVGAGLSGLSAAYYLKKAGKSCVILEMSPHIGGRIRTANYAGQAHAEIGLEEFWENNPAIQILQELKVPLESSYSSFSSLYRQGRIYPFTQSDNFGFLQSVLDADEVKAYQAWDKTMAELYRQLEQRPLPQSLLALKELSFAEWLRTTSGLSAKALDFVRIETEPEYATSWDKISALDGIAEWHLFSGQGLTPRHVVGGNQHAARAIADFIGYEHIRLNQLVTHIEADDNGVEITAIDQSDFQQRIFRARHAITAIPLFRLNDIQFSPPLSPERIEAIKTQASGAYFTAHVLLDNRASRFWTQDQESILPILSDGPLGVIYEGHTAANRDALLNLLISGSHAERFNARGDTPEETKAILSTALEKLWPGIGAMIKQMTFYRYHPRAIAAWPVGRSRFDGLSESLRQPQGRVYFAGDFTEDTHSNGAVNAAIRAVNGILQEAEAD